MLFKNWNKVYCEMCLEKDKTVGFSVHVKWTECFCKQDNVWLSISKTKRNTEMCITIYWIKGWKLDDKTLLWEVKFYSVIWKKSDTYDIIQIQAKWKN